MKSSIKLLHNCGALRKESTALKGTKRVCLWEKIKFEKFSYWASLTVLVKAPAALGSEVTACLFSVCVRLHDIPVWRLQAFPYTRIQVQLQAVCASREPLYPFILCLWQPKSNSLFCCTQCWQLKLILIEQIWQNSTYLMNSIISWHLDLSTTCSLKCPDTV